MTMVGLLPMKRASGSAASSMTATATRTAANMIGRSSVMPTAVMMLSSEKTMSSTRIWPIAEAIERLPAPTLEVSLPCPPSPATLS